MCKHNNEGKISYGKNKFGETITILRCNKCGEKWDYYPQYTDDGVK